MWAVLFFFCATMSADDIDDAICTICADGETEALVQIDCGHRFHSACILEWFRHYSTTCPNCRSDGILRRWHHACPEERIEHLKRSRETLDPVCRKKLDEMIKKTTRLRKLRKEHDLFGVAHAGILKRHRSLTARIENLEADVRYLTTDLADVHMPGSTLLSRRR